MRFEYQGNVKLSDPQARELVEKLAAHPGWKLVAREERRVSFLFPKVHETHWKEHFYVKIRPDGSIFLMFNGAEPEQEESVRQAIAAALQKMGTIGLQFEEA